MSHIKDDFSPVEICSLSAEESRLLVKAIIKFGFLSSIKLSILIFRYLGKFSEIIFIWKYFSSEIS